ncbi:MAG: anhydro-N-acetylmuramic acid kinase, partial [Anaerolineae bacterium]|nr:anhydro-N-acetylmuramic acid kinase [Anaerolineae bacterium]
HRPGVRCDVDGQWARGGQVLQDLLDAMLQDPYFDAPPPKSTGRDHFDAGWLDAQLRDWPQAGAQDVQATLAELTARACARDLMRHASGVSELLLCGGGVHNADLVDRLQRNLPTLPVRPTTARGVPVTHVEALGFAWLARQTLMGRRQALGDITGSPGTHLLGAIWPR